MRSWFVLSLLLLAPSLVNAQAPSPAQGRSGALHLGMTYEEETPPNLARYELRRLSGVVVDRVGNVIPNLGLGLFTDDAKHTLVAFASSGDAGKFDFGKAIPDGNYRLIAKYPGLCTANIPIAVYKKSPTNHHLEIRMEFPGLDVCSYAMQR